MAKKIIITIARQYGSAGREIGEKVAAALGIPLYDKELIKEAASKGDLNEEVLKNADEQAANSLLYTLAMGSNILGTTMNFGYKMPINDKLFILQSEVIKEYAAKGSCVIIGRCADYVLREHDNVVKVYIYADYERRVERAVERHDLTEQKAKQMVTKVDKSRANYYSFYSGEKWGLVDNYDLCINSTNLSVEQAVDIILSYINVINNK